MDIGALVEFRVHGDRQLAVITGAVGKGKLSLRDPVGHIHTVHPRQVSFVIPGGALFTTAIPSFGQDVEALVEATDLEVAWELLAEEQTPVTPQELADLLFGERSAKTCYAAHILLSNDRVYFKQKGDAYEARTSTQVEEIRHQLAMAERKILQQTEFITRIQAKLRHEAVTWQEFDRGRLDLLERYVLWQEECTERNQARDLLRQLGQKEEPQAAHQLLVQLEWWSPHENLALRRAGVPIHFSSAVLAEAHRLRTTPPPDRAERRVLSRLAAYAIDDPTTTEVDDALSIEKLPEGGDRLWIHIADPTRWVEVASPLDLEARKRGTSIYLPERTIPMFPPELAAGPMSLLPGRENCALSFAVQLGPLGEVAHYEIFTTTLDTVYRLDYQEVDQLLETGVEPVLERLRVLADLRRSYRQGLGSVQIDMPEAVIKVKNQGQDLHLEVLTDSPARALVSEMMILVGEVTALYAVAHDLPVPFRVQPTPALPPPEELDRLPYGVVRDYALCRCMQRGELRALAGRHGGLGLAGYAQATSPIRRYSDLLVHFQLKAHLAQHTLPYDLNGLKDVLMTLESATSEAVRVERENVRYWVLEYLHRHQDQVQPALVLDWFNGDPYRPMILLENCALRIPIRLDRPVQRGDMLDLEIAQVDPSRDQIILKEVSA